MASAGMIKRAAYKLRRKAKAREENRGNHGTVAYLLNNGRASRREVADIYASLGVPRRGLVYSE